MSQTTLSAYDVLKSVVESKLNITPRIEKELELLKDAPSFIPEAFLKSYQLICLDGREPGTVNDCHSLIAYELGITSVHPNNISFHYPVKSGEFPDVDTDFAYPEQVKDYLKEKYGEDRVVGIPTYGRYKVKGLLSDLCRVYLDENKERVVSLEEVKALNKSLPHKIDQKVSEDMLDDDDPDDDDEELFSNSEIQDFQHKYPQIFEHFKALYASPKYRGRHAAGTVILPQPARDTLPLSMVTKKVCTEWTEGQGVSELGSVGVLKIDILGLKTLKILDTANKLILERYQLDENTPSPCACKKEGVQCDSSYQLPFMVREATGERLIDFNHLCLNVPKVYKAIGDFQTQGVFQFEPEGISGFTHKYNPKRFYDLALISALYRPGPLDARLDEHGMPIDPEDPEYRKAPSAAMVFIERHNGRSKIHYASQKLEEVLKDSYGIAVFQEHISLIVMAMTGCGFAEAEKLRKFLTKVKPEALKSNPAVIAELKGHEEKFTKQSLVNGCNEKETEAVWNLIVPFARYGFNKAHAVTYSLISFQTAFCRTLFPLEYLTSLMIHNVDNTDKLIEYVRTAQKLGYDVLPPNINESQSNFIINKDEKIVAGFEFVKGVGEKAATQIITNRNEVGPFTSLEDFLGRKIKWAQVNVRVLFSLIKAGAFDSIAPNRALTLAQVAVLKKQAKITDFETIDIFTEEGNEETKITELHIVDWDKKTKTDYERESFGFLLEDFVAKNKKNIILYHEIIKNLSEQYKKHATIGTISDLKELDQKNGQKYARINVVNIDGIKEHWLLFASVWKVFKSSIKDFETYIAIGKKDEKGTVIVDSLELVSNLI